MTLRRIDKTCGQIRRSPWLWASLSASLSVLLSHVAVGVGVSVGSEIGAAGGSMLRVRSVGAPPSKF